MNGKMTKRKNKKRLLYLEDYSCAAESFIPRCEHLGYLVIHYALGKKAVEALENGLNYELAIIDRELGAVSGDEVIKTCKRYHPNTPVICLSGYEDIVKDANITLVKTKDTLILHKLLRRYIAQEDNTLLPL
mgnify:FL=1